MGRRGNPYFHFQQFSIWQDRCAMKVGVDGILLGAWASPAHRILDIGTGTGLIALMMAQRSPNAQITALEIDSKASQQARENIARSPWPDRIDVITIAYQDYLKSQVFDGVIANPPFFKASDHCNTPRAIARQQRTLSAKIILQSIGPHLSAHGKLSMIVPFDQDLEAIASQQGLFLSRKTNIRPTVTSPFRRSLIEFSVTKSTPSHGQIVIEQSRHQYSSEYKELIGQFLLKFEA